MPKPLDFVNSYQLLSEQHGSDSPVAQSQTDHESPSQRIYKESAADPSPVLTAVDTADESDKSSQISQLNETSSSTPGSPASTLATQESTTDCDRLTSCSPSYRRPCLLEQSPVHHENVYLYPYSEGEISNEDTECLYETIQKYLKILHSNIKTNAVLSSGRISIKCYMAGPSPENAVASIIVTCNPCMLETIRDLLIPKERTSSVWRKSKRKSKGSSKRLDKATVTHFYTGRAAASALAGTDCKSLTTVDEVHSYPSLYGHQVRALDGILFSTLSCVLEHDGSFYGLTTAHAFYENCLAQSFFNSTSQDTGIGYTAPCVVDLEYTTVTTSVWFPSRGQSASDISGKDWGLILLNNMAIKAWKRPSSLSNTFTVQGIVDKHPGKSRKVMILSSASSPMMGTLVRGVTHLVAMEIEELSLWSVELSSDSCLRPGVSGSLVVDAITKQAYGYIVASDPFGKALIVPLYLVLQDISTSTNMKSIHMAELELVPMTSVSAVTEPCINLTTQSHEVLEPVAEKTSPDITTENDDMIPVRRKSIVANFDDAATARDKIPRKRTKRGPLSCAVTGDASKASSAGMCKGTVLGGSANGDDRENNRIVSPNLKQQTAGVKIELPPTDSTASDDGSISQSSTTHHPPVVKEYECPFNRLDCPDVFTSFKPWYEHSLMHFQDHEPPTRNSCCFCTKVFNRRDPKDSWRARMQHIREHHDRGERLATSRFDESLYSYLLQKKLIEEEQWEKLKSRKSNWHETNKVRTARTSGSSVGSRSESITSTESATSSIVTEPSDLSSTRESKRHRSIVIHIPQIPGSTADSKSESIASIETGAPSVLSASSSLLNLKALPGPPSSPISPSLPRLPSRRESHRHKVPVIHSGYHRSLADSIVRPLELVATGPPSFMSELPGISSRRAPTISRPIGKNSRLLETEGPLHRQPRQTPFSFMYPREPYIGYHESRNQRYLDREMEAETLRRLEYESQMESLRREMHELETRMREMERETDTETRERLERLERLSETSVRLDDGRHERNGTNLERWARRRRANHIAW